MSKRSAQRARGRARWERRKKARYTARYPQSENSFTVVGPSRVIAHLTPDMVREMRKSGMLYRPPSLRGKRRRTRRYRERQL